MNKIRVFIYTFLVTLCAPTMANNGVETIEFSFERGSFDVDCLKESVSGIVHVTAKGHSFKTPSGNGHIVDNWRYTVVLTGESSGKTWIGSGVSPSRENITKNGEAFGFTNKVLMKPLDGGPKFRFNAVVRVRFDENGNVVSVIDKFATEEFYRCLGPDK